MRKQDIKPGVVYAYGNGRSEHHTPYPIVFLAAPADGVLYRRAGHHSPETAPAFIAAGPGSKPKRASGFAGVDVGYPAARITPSAPDGTSSGDLLKLTLADFKAALTPRREDGIAFTIITSLVNITGTYAEQQAEHEAQRRASDERRAAERAARDRSHARADSVLAALSRAGIKADRDSPYGLCRAISLPLGDAEKLAALLDRPASTTDSTEGGQR